MAEIDIQLFREITDRAEKAEAEVAALRAEVENAQRHWIDAEEAMKEARDERDALRAKVDTLEAERDASQKHAFVPCPRSHGPCARPGLHGMLRAPHCHLPGCGKPASRPIHAQGPSR